MRHLRQHVADPADGLALAADRRDLQRLRSGTPPAGIAAAIAVGHRRRAGRLLRILADLWYARLVDRTPFGMMPRERLAGLTRACSRRWGSCSREAGAPGSTCGCREVQEELAALVRAASGQGEVSDAAIDLALRVADAAATGRPMIGPGPYPCRPADRRRRGPAGAVPGLGPEAPAGRYPGSAPRCRPGGPTPYALPPGYEAYSGAAAAGAGGIVACQTLRTAAGVSQGVSDMVRAAECWTRTPTWPGWGAQSLEALDWATSLAAIERNCTALGTAIDSLRELGPAPVGRRPQAARDGTGTARRGRSPAASRSVPLQVIEHGQCSCARTPSGSVSSSRSKYSVCTIAVIFFASLRTPRKKNTPGISFW